MDYLHNATENISFQTITERLVEEWQISSPVLFVIGIVLLFQGSNLWAFGRNNIFVPTTLCICVHFFRPSLGDVVQHFPSSLDEYIACVESNTCKWEHYLFEFFWFALAIGLSMALNRYTKLGEKVIVGVLALGSAGTLSGTLSKIVFRRLVGIRGLMCNVVSDTTDAARVNTKEMDQYHMKIATVIFGLAGALFVVPRALSIYRVLLRVVTSLLGAFLVATSLTVVSFVHGYERASQEGWLIHALPSWITITMIFTPVLAFWGFIWQETSHARYVRNKALGQETSDSNSSNINNNSGNNKRRIRSNTPERKVDRMNT